MIIKSNSQFVAVDQYLPQTISNRTVEVVAGVDAPANATVEKVIIRINFDKISTEDCSNYDPDDWAFSDEIGLKLISPSATEVILVEPHVTYEDEPNPMSRVEILFDDDAAEKVGDDQASLPISGTFQPEKPLSAFYGETAIGIWTLEVLDSNKWDSLCFYFYELIIETNE